MENVRYGVSGDFHFRFYCCNWSNSELHTLELANACHFRSSQDKFLADLGFIVVSKYLTWRSSPFLGIVFAWSRSYPWERLTDACHRLSRSLARPRLYRDNLSELRLFSYIKNKVSAAAKSGLQVHDDPDDTSGEE